MSVGFPSHAKSLRHSGESRNPIAVGKGPSVRQWTPACAGVTTAFWVNASARKLSPSGCVLFVCRQRRPGEALPLSVVGCPSLKEREAIPAFRKPFDHRSHGLLALHRSTGAMYSPNGEPPAKSRDRGKCLAEANGFRALTRTAWNDHRVSRPDSHREGSVLPSEALAAIRA